MKNDIEEIKVVLDEVLINTSILNARISTLTAMVCGVYKEQLPAEVSNSILSKFFDMLENMVDDHLTQLEQRDILYSSSRALKEKFDNHIQINALRKEWQILD